MNGRVGARQTIAIWTALGLCAAALPAQQAPPAGRVAVVVTGIRPEQAGSLVVALYHGPDGWLKLERAYAVHVVPAADESLTVTFDSVPYDSTWAIEVFHDRNGNRKFDMRWFPFPRPKEGAGVSGNHTRMGPPDYAKARFTVAGSAVTLTITLRY
jgi:uncharacterized protein (DUF2141 family)